MNKRLTEKPIEILFHGDKVKIHLEEAKYASGSLAIIAITENEAPFGKVSTNLAIFDDLPEDEFFAKVWAENEWVPQLLEECDLFEDTGKSTSTGWEIAPIWRLKRKPVEEKSKQKSFLDELEDFLSSKGGDLPSPIKDIAEESFIAGAVSTMKYLMEEAQEKDIIVPRNLAELTVQIMLECIEKTQQMAEKDKFLTEKDLDDLEVTEIISKKMKGMFNEGK